LDVGSAALSWRSARKSQRSGQESVRQAEEACAKLRVVKRGKLIVASSEDSADMLYATRFRAPDAFVFVEAQGRTAILLSDLEVDRGRREAKVDEVVSYSELEKKVQGVSKQKPSHAKLIAEFVKSRGVRRVLTPGDFPLGLARSLEKTHIRAEPVKGPLWPQREIKNRWEVDALRAALRITEAGMARGHEILKAASIRKDRKLLWKRQVLTSEILRIEMEAAVLRAGGEARGDTIVACGEQACDPHERGSGPLYANQLIILDIFPRDARSGYFGDLTRTVVRGTANEAQRRLWETCLRGQRRALRALKPGVSGEKIHEEVKAFFAASGYPTEIKDGRWRGFFHGTGHGLGLEIHEEPRFAAATFRPGQVFTVEPGIYWPGIGGVRHEDVAVITAKGHRLISHFPKELEI
jgi:Xaa-Pro aminopeptidase